MDMFASIGNVHDALTAQGYLAGKRTATALYLAWHRQKPLLVEGPAGVGKTGLAAACAGAMGTDLVRLQCYPGLDEAKALYEWNYQKQLLYMNAGRREEWEHIRKDVFSPDFLLERPFLKAFRADRPVVLLVDEVDKSDEELESFFLEALSEYQVTIPEMGTLRARHIPLAILTSNSSRDFGDALKRRCLHLFIPYPGVEQELAIVLTKVPHLSRGLAGRLVEFVQTLRRLPLKKPPSIAETIDWAATMLLLGARYLDPDLVAATLGTLLKYEEDVQKVTERLPDLIPLGGPEEKPSGDREAVDKKQKGTRLDDIFARFAF